MVLVGAAALPPDLGCGICVARPCPCAHMYGGECELSSWRHCWVRQQWEGGHITVTLVSWLVASSTEVEKSFVTRIKSQIHCSGWDVTWQTVSCDWCIWTTNTLYIMTFFLTASSHIFLLSFSACSCWALWVPIYHISWQGTQGRRTVLCHANFMPQVQEETS